MFPLDKAHRLLFDAHLFIRPLYNFYLQHNNFIWISCLFFCFSHIYPLPIFCWIHSWANKILILSLWTTYSTLAPEKRRYSLAAILVDHQSSYPPDLDYFISLYHYTAPQKIHRRMWKKQVRASFVGTKEALPGLFLAGIWHKSRE